MTKIEQANRAAITIGIGAADFWLVTEGAGDAPAPFNRRCASAVASTAGRPRAYQHRGRVDWFHFLSTSVVAKHIGMRRRGGIPQSAYGTNRKKQLRL